MVTELERMPVSDLVGSNFGGCQLMTERTNILGANLLRNYMHVPSTAQVMLFTPSAFLRRYYSNLLPSLLSS